MYIKIETNANIDMETGVLLNYLCFVCDSIAQKSFEYSLVVSVFSYTVGGVHPPSLTVIKYAFTSRPTGRMRQIPRCSVLFNSPRTEESRPHVVG